MMKNLFFLGLMFFIQSNLLGQTDTITLFRTFSINGNSTISRIVPIGCPTQMPKSVCDNCYCYGHISYVEQSLAIDTRIKIGYCVYAGVSSTEVINYRVGTHRVTDLDPIGISYSYNTKTKTLFEVKASNYQPPYIVDKAPNRFYKLKSGENIYIAIMKMLISREAFNAIFTDNKLYEYAKTKSELKKLGLYSYE